MTLQQFKELTFVALPAFITVVMGISALIIVCRGADIPSAILDLLKILAGYYIGSAVAKASA